MASTNQSPFYKKAESKFLSAQSDEERLTFLEEMIKECPKHKSSENMLANLKTRRKKLEQQLVKAKRSGKSTYHGIKKEDLQAVIIGMTNTGRSSLLSFLTNAKTQIAEHEFITKSPIVGMMNFEGTNIQLIEVPAFKSEYYDKGLVNTANSILIVATNLEQLKEIEKELNKAHGKRIIVFNKIDMLNQNEIRKISATLASKKYNFVLISTKTQEGIEELKNKLFRSFNKIRVYTKEPGKDKAKKPVILNLNSTIKDVAKKILKGSYKDIKETKIWGPSSKFAGQTVGSEHKLKDLDVVEFKTK